MQSLHGTWESLQGTWEAWMPTGPRHIRPSKEGWKGLSPVVQPYSLGRSLMTGTPGQHLQTHHCHNTMLTSGRAAMGGVGEEGERMGGG